MLLFGVKNELPTQAEIRVLPQGIGATRLATVLSFLPGMEVIKDP